MQCPNCHADYVEADLYCRQCGEDLAVPSTSVVPVHSRIPALFQNQQFSRSVVAGVGAVALGVGLELLRRGLLARMMRPRVAESALPVLSGLKDVMFPQDAKQNKLPKGYEIRETVVLVQRVIRRG